MAYAAAKNVRILKGATSLRAQEGSYEEQGGEFDCTHLAGSSNAQGLLATEFGMDTITTNLNFTVVVEKTDLVAFNVGALLDSVSYVGDDSTTHVGAYRIKSRSKPVSTRGAFRVACQGTFTGVVTNQ